MMDHDILFTQQIEPLAVPAWLNRLETSKLLTCLAASMHFDTHLDYKRYGRDGWT